MNIDQTIKDLKASETYQKYVRILKNATLDYQSNPQTYEKNKTRALYGAAATGAVSLVAGPGLITAAAALYTGVKTYQAVKDRR